MTMKRVLLASSAVAIILAMSPVAEASGSLYFSAFGGANWLRSDANPFLSSSSSTSQSLRASADTGFVIGAAVGLHLDNWLNGLRAEWEASYRRNKVHGIWTESGTSSGPFEGRESTFAMMANVWYDINIGSKLVPYVGGGVGAATAQNSGVIIDVSRIAFVDATFDNRYFGMAWQLGAGVHYEFMHGANIGLGYRYFRGPDFHYAGVSGGEGSIDDWIGTIKNENHEVMVDLTIDID